MTRAQLLAWFYGRVDAPHGRDAEAQAHMIAGVALAFENTLAREFHGQRIAARAAANRPWQ